MTLTTKRQGGFGSLQNFAVFNGNEQVGIVSQFQRMKPTPGPIRWYSMVFQPTSRSLFGDADGFDTLEQALAALEGALT